LGIVIEVKPLQQAKAWDPIKVTELGMSIEVKPQQKVNALPRIIVTEFGIVIDDKLERPENAPIPIEVTEFGIIVFTHPATNSFVDVLIMALQSSRESKQLLSGSTFIETKL
jgi:hypothetical protein